MYCNYSKDKFGNELTFIIPSWLNNVPEGNAYWHDGICYRVGQTKENIFGISVIPNIGDNYKEIHDFLTELEKNEKTYFKLLKRGWTAQQARTVLPNCLKTELIMTGFASDWKHFFSLRDDKQHAHPDAYVLAHPLHEEFIKRGYLNE